MICRTQDIPKTMTIFSDEASNASKHFYRAKFFVKAYFDENQFLPFLYKKLFLKSSLTER